MRKVGFACAIVSLLVCFFGCEPIVSFEATVLQVSSDGQYITVVQQESLAETGLFTVNVEQADIRDGKGEYPLSEIGPGDRVTVRYMGVAHNPDRHPDKFPASDVVLREYHSASFAATVLETLGNATTLLVEPEESSVERNTADRISVGLSDALIYGAKEAAWLNGPISPQDLNEGDKVIICYDGAIAESYPAQIMSCTLILME